MKKILFIGTILLMTFLIYLSFIDKKVYYVALGDSLATGMTPYGTEDYGYTDYIKDYLEQNDLLETYINQYAKSNYRITDLTNAIKENKKIVINNKEKTIKNVLIKADLITLSIGLNDILTRISLSPTIDYNALYDYIDETIEDLEELLIYIRQYCKEDIILVGYYNPFTNLEPSQSNQLFEYVNKRYQELSDNYQIQYIEIYSKLQDKKYFPNPKDIHPSKEGYKVIADSIIKVIDNTLLK